MSNLLLLKSKVADPKFDCGDIIIDLDKVISIYTKFIKEKYYVIDFDIVDKEYHISFDKKEDAINFLEIALIKMGAEPSLAKQIIFENVSAHTKNEMDKLKDIIKEVMK